MWSVIAAMQVKTEFARELNTGRLFKGILPNEKKDLTGCQTR